MTVRAQPASVTGAEITWYGVYQAEQAKVQQEVGALGGKRRISRDVIRPTANSDRIPIADNTRFGFGYRVTGAPAGASVKITVKQQMPPPGALNTVTGRRTTSGQVETNAKIGAGLFTGWVIGKASATPAGNWTFEIWYEGRKLTGKTFTLYRP